MRVMIFSLVALLGLSSCNQNVPEVLSPSELSAAVAAEIAANFSVKDIEYCGAAFLKSELKGVTTYSEVSRSKKSHVDQWLGAYRLASGKDVSLSSFLSKANKSVLKFLNNPEVGTRVDGGLLTRCSTAGNRIKFDAVRRAVEDRK